MQIYTQSEDAHKVKMQDYTQSEDPIRSDPMDGWMDKKLRYTQKHCNKNMAINHIVMEESCGPQSEILRSWLCQVIESALQNSSLKRSSQKSPKSTNPQIPKSKNPKI